MVEDVPVLGEVFPVAGEGFPGLKAYICQCKNLVDPYSGHLVSKLAGWLS